MGSSKYIQELWRKKQSDVLRFLLRIRCWEYRQWRTIERVPQPTRPEKARRLGYRAKQGYVIYRIRVRRGDRKRKVPKVSTNEHTLRLVACHVLAMLSVCSADFGLDLEKWA